MADRNAVMAEALLNGAEHGEAKYSPRTQRRPGSKAAQVVWSRAVNTFDYESLGISPSDPEAKQVMYEVKELTDHYRSKEAVYKARAVAGHLSER